MRQRLLHLLQKYNVPGPRYTSYPTAPAWKPEVGPADYSASLASLHPEDPLSLYFHLPFCEKLCHFCGCMKVITSDRGRSRDYVDRLLKELELVLEKLPVGAKKVSQLHFGGGTPNFLQPGELKELVRTVRLGFDVIGEAEVAIELHPRTSSREFCEMLRELEFNRISLGVQDFDPRVQNLINRFQTYEQTVEMVKLLRELGFRSFNFDLIYGLPGQSREGWARTIEQILEIRPNRLAVYSYAHVPWISPVQRSFNDSDLPSPAAKLGLFEQAYKAFLQAGYRPIGMDHFALADDELSRAFDQGTLHRNFMGYSTQADAHQLGLGVSSISFVGGNYFQNWKELPHYEAAIQQRRLATFRGFLLSEDDAIRRDLITRIMCLGKIDLADFETKWKLDFDVYFAEDLAALQEIMDDGLLNIDNSQLMVTGEGHLFLRNLAMIFDRYLGKLQNVAKNPIFSKTI